jgi:hypothetical protein
MPHGHDPHRAGEGGVKSEPDREPHFAPSRRAFLAASGVLAGAAVLAIPTRPAVASPMAGTAPVIYPDQVRTARPSEVLSLAGAGLTETVVLKLWAIPNDTSAPMSVVPLPATPPAASTSLTVFAASGDNVMTEIPPGIADGAYAIYASADGGTTWSSPFLINSAQPWYLDHATAAPGALVTVIGPTVSRAGATPQVYLRSSAGLTACAATAASEYEVAFTVPATLASGTYTVLVSNGRGGHYAYDSSLPLTVGGAAAPPGTTYNVVADFGADPTGATDATPSIQNALAAAAAHPGGARVSLPAGTYTINSKLSLAAGAAGIQIVGAGAGSTTVRMSDGAPFSPDIPINKSTDVQGVKADDQYGMLYLAPSSQPVELSGITFDTNGKRGVVLEIDGRNGVSVTETAFVADSYPDDVSLYAGVCSILAQNTREVTIDGCSFTCNKGIFLINVVDVRVQNNTFAIFYPRHPGDPNAAPHADNDGVQVWGARRLTIRGNTFARGSSTYHYARAVQTGALKISHGLFGTADACGVEDLLIAHNTVDGAGQPGGSNNGEVFVGDTFNGITGGIEAIPVSSATANTIAASGVTFAVNSAQDPIGAHVFLLNGTGAGQVRRVVGNTTTTLTVDRAWDVLPDTTSSFVVDVVHARQLSVHNTITACSKYIGNYGPSLLSVVAQNDFDSTGAPGVVTPQGCGAGFFGLLGGTAAAVKFHPVFYNLIADNTFTAAHALLSYQNFSGGVPPYPILRGNVVTRNVASEITEVVALANSGATPIPAATWGRYNAIVQNRLGASVTDEATLDGGWDRSLYQGSPSGLVDGGNNTVVVPNSAWRSGRRRVVTLTPGRGQHAKGQAAATGSVIA